MAFPKKKKELTQEQKEEKREQRQQRKIRKSLQKEFYKLVEDNPAIKYKLMEKEFGIKMPEYDPDKNLENTIAARAIEMINRDRPLQEDLVLRYLHNKAAELGIETDSPEVRLEKQKEQFRQMKEILDMMGIKTNPSIWDVLKDPRVISELIKVIGQVVTSRQASPAPESDKTYVVEIDGRFFEMNAEEYKAYNVLRNKYKLTQNAEAVKSDEAKAPVPEIASIDLSNTKILPDKNSNN